MKFLVAHLSKTKANSKKEKHVDSSGKISTDLLNQNDKQQSPSYSIKINECYIRVEAILEFNDAEIGLKVMKENSPNKTIVGYLNINS